MIDCDGAAVHLGLEDDSSTFFTFLDYRAISGRENDTDELNLGAKLHWDMKNSFLPLTITDREYCWG